jgi:hypothetical protein
MGTSSRLVKNDEPISGLATIDQDNSLVVPQVRLPPSLRDLGPSIIRAVRRQGG